MSYDFWKSSSLKTLSPALSLNDFLSLRTGGTYSVGCLSESLFKNSSTNSSKSPWFAFLTPTKASSISSLSKVVRFGSPTSYPSFIMSAIVSLISLSDLLVAFCTSDEKLSNSFVETCFGSGDVFLALSALSASRSSKLMPRTFIIYSSNDITSASTLSTYLADKASSENSPTPVLFCISEKDSGL